VVPHFNRDVLLDLHWFWRGGDGSRRIYFAVPLSIAIERVPPALELRLARTAVIKPRIAPFPTHGLARRLRINPLVRNGAARGPGEQPPRGLSIFVLCDFAQDSAALSIKQHVATNGGSCR